MNEQDVKAIMEAFEIQVVDKADWGGDINCMHAVEILRHILTEQLGESEYDEGDWFMYGSDGRRHKLAKPTDVTITQNQIIEWVENACEPDKEYTNTYIVPIGKLMRFLRNPKLWEHALKEHPLTEWLGEHGENWCTDDSCVMCQEQAEQLGESDNKVLAGLIVKLAEHIESMTPERMIVKRWVREAKSKAELILTE